MRRERLGGIGTGGGGVPQSVVERGGWKSSITILCDKDTSFFNWKSACSQFAKIVMII